VAYEFHSAVFDTAAEMYDAIVAEWISASGMNSDEWTLSEKSDEELADLAIQQWRLDKPEWAEPRSFSREGLIEAFAKSREPLL
jgi:aryl-alcohol dehydrogenase-like predicted oxidoreductase